LTVSRRDPESGEYTMERAPCYHLVDDDEESTSSGESAQKLSA
jgi:adenylylsulfate reductase subunit A